jgi:hypothetical protein
MAAPRPAVCHCSVSIMSTIHSRLLLLAQLFESLPETIPYNPVTSQYNFSINTAEMDEDDGAYQLVNRCLEVSFQTHVEQNFKILERGQHLLELVQLLKWAVENMPPSEHDFLRDVWVECLIRAAEASGAKLESSSKRYVSCI